MKFKLSVSENWYKDSEEVAKLKTLGFQFGINQFLPNAEGAYLLSHQNVEIEINTLDELISFSKEWGALIVCKDEIEIYNGFVE